MTNTNLTLTFTKLSVSYSGTPALKGLSGTFLPGRVTALIGPNGSGKSTLLKALSGLLPYSGSVVLAGREIRDFKRRELGRLLGIMAQRSGAKAAFTVHDVIGFGRLPWQSLLAPASKEDEKMILTAAAELGVTQLLARPATELSGGELQRVMLAMIAAQDPKVLLLDEPTSAMDPFQAARAFHLMRCWAESGKTVIAAVHDINTALTAADNYYAVRNGQTISSGQTADISAEVLQALYDTPFTAYTSLKGDKVWHPDF
jgi:ABC-type cobalamin/Fe3+-siderophores transport system ATPase subunit